MATRATYALTGEELRALARAVPATPTGTRDLALLHLLYTTGLRVAEALALQPADLVIAPDGYLLVEVHRGKGGTPRTAICSPALATHLTDWIRTRGHLLRAQHQHAALFCRLHPRPSPAPIGARAVQRMLHRLAARAGLHRAVRPHLLRHTYATAAVDAGAELRDVQAQLGHARSSTTQIYVHDTTRSRRAAADLLPELT